MKRTLTLLGLAGLGTLGALWIQGSGLSNASMRTGFGPDLEARLEQSLVSSVDQLTSEHAARFAITEAGQLAGSLDSQTVLENITALLDVGDFEEIGNVLYRHLAASSDPIAAVTDILRSPLERPIDAIAAGLVLQASLRYASAGAAFMQGAQPADIAFLALDCFDASHFASRALLTGMGSMGGELPGSLIGELIERMRGTEVTHNQANSQLDRLHLLQQWAVSMGPDAAVTLQSVAHDPESSLAVRAGGVLGLMNRDWRLHGPDLAELFRELKAEGLASETGPGFLFMANLAGTNLTLHGRERLELLREIIGDEEIATYALGSLPEDMRYELAVYANEEDREWGPFRWVELAGNGEAAVEAGFSLLEDTRDHPNVAHGYEIVQRLMTIDGSDPRLHDELEWRFSSRHEPDDLFWGLFDFNQSLLPKSVQTQDIPRYLEQTRGDQHPTRLRVLAGLRNSHPHLAAGLE